MAKIPKTSLEAYRSITNEQLAKDYQRVIDALKVLGEGCINSIAMFMKVDDNKISRRTKEMVLKGILYKTGKRMQTKSGRWADTLGLTENIGKDIKPLHESIIPNGQLTDRVKKNEQSVEKYAKKILNSPTLF